MSRNLYIGVGVVVVIVLLMMSGFLRPPSLSPLPHGYSGLVSNISDVDYPEVYDDAGVTYINDFYWAGIDPTWHYVGGTIITTNPTAIRASVTSPQERRPFFDLDPIKSLEYFWQGGVQYVKNTTQRVSMVYLECFMTIQTVKAQWSDAGVDPVYDIVFWVTLEQNAYTVFQDADSSAAATISVRTDTVDITQEAEEFELALDAGGQDMPLYSVATESNLPDDVGDYNIENLRLFEKVKFPVHVIIADPFPATVLGPRVDCQATINFYIDVVLFGEWVETRPYHEYVPPPPDLTLWERLMELIDNVIDAILTPLGIVVVMLAIVGTVILVIRVRGFILVFGMVVLWVAVIFVLGMIGVAVIT